MTRTRGHSSRSWPRPGPASRPSTGHVWLRKATQYYDDIHRPAGRGGRPSGMFRRGPPGLRPPRSLNTLGPAICNSLFQGAREMWIDYAKKKTQPILHVEDPTYVT